MSAWDEAQVFVSDPIGEGQNVESSHSNATNVFYEFIRNFRQEGNNFVYRDQLRRHYNLREYYLEVQLEDLSSYHEAIATFVQNNPSEYMPLFEAAATRAADSITSPRGDGSSVHKIQVTLRSQAHPTILRELGSNNVEKLVKVSGIIISAAAPRAKATTLTIACRQCRTTRQWPVRAGFGGAKLPRTCSNSSQVAGEEKCPIDPYQILPDKSECVDQQALKLQELPESVPTGEMPRHMLLSADRNLTDKVMPGTRCTIIGIFSIFSERKKSRNTSGTSGARQPYIRVTGIEVDSTGAGRSTITFTADEEEEMRTMAKDPEIYERICRSIAPSIYGSEDIKKAVACVLFGGSTKQLPDQMRLRGDVNVLLLGDPGTAKSQMLKFTEQVAPIAVYTSGKGSSAAGLTASVIRDPSSREFHLEGGAMVLADGGVVCIDEFDKMRESDRVAIHEAMEQQTISIAKAGITTTLNSRTSVLAAANSVFGRWDDTKTTDENVEFQSTILSRFDLIFIVKDEHNEERDELMARHVMSVHLNAASVDKVEGELDVDLLKKYINFCRTKCGPRLSPSAAEKLQNHFVTIRADTRQVELDTDRRTAIPITVRQLEALVRLSEALAKMQMEPFATEHHVDEAIRLFKVSTIDAALSGHISVEGGNEAGMEDILKVENNVKRRFPVGSRVSESRIIADFTKRNHSEAVVRKVINIMLRRGELEHQMQRRVLYRVK